MPGSCFSSPLFSLTFEKWNRPSLRLARLGRRGLREDGSGAGRVVVGVVAHVLLVLQPSLACPLRRTQGVMRMM